MKKKKFLYQLLLMTVTINFVATSCFPHIVLNYAAKPAHTATSTVPAGIKLPALPMRFELAAQSNCAISHGSNYNLCFTANKITFAPHSLYYNKAPLQVLLSGANKAVEIVGRKQIATCNYLLGSDPSSWRKDVRQYAQLQYQQLYHGIDALFYGNGDQLEYDFIVAPGAQPRQIRLTFDNAEKVAVDPDGNLLIDAAGSHLYQHKPIIYQESHGNKEFISGEYYLTANNQVGFKIGNYDHHRTLIIDPVIDYAVSIGGSKFEYGTGIAVDKTGNTYIVGTTESFDFPVVNGFQEHSPLDPIEPSNIKNDLFILKLNPAGNRIIYSTYLGGSGIEFATSIAIDNAGSVYVAGVTDSDNFPIYNALQPQKGSPERYGQDAFITKLNPNGNALEYSTYLGGNGADQANGITVDNAGNAYIVGATTSADFPVVNALQAQCNSCQRFTYLGVLTTNHDGFIAKLNADGDKLLFATFLGGKDEPVGYDTDNYGDDLAYRVALDGNNDIYVFGMTTSPTFPVTAQAFQSTLHGNSDLFVAKLTNNGERLVYATYLGGSSTEYVTTEMGGLAVDNAGNAYLTGHTRSLDFPVMHPIQHNQNADDAFVAKLDPTGSQLIYSTYLGSKGQDYGHAIVVDSHGNAYVTGETNSQDFPLVNPIKSVLKWDRYAAGAPDIFVAKINARGNKLLFATFLGGNYPDGGAAIAIDAAHNIYLTGATYSQKFAGMKPLPPTKTINGHAIIIKISGQ